jgi:hypothetical protein
MTWNIEKVSHAELYWICVADVKAVSDEYEKGLSEKMNVLISNHRTGAEVFLSQDLVSNGRGLDS